MYNETKGGKIYIYVFSIQSDMHERTAHFYHRELVLNFRFRVIISIFYRYYNLSIKFGHNSYKSK